MKIEKRLFFAAEVEAPWPDEYPPGRLIEEPCRHITLAFLGNIPYQKLYDALNSFPPPPFKIGPSGKCDKLLFLPEHDPRVVALHIQWLDKEQQLNSFQKSLLQWLEERGYKVDTRELLSHVSLARSPFEEQSWKDSFLEIPIFIKAIHLYESVGNLHYLPRWHFTLTPPFEEIGHTADIAFNIQGETYSELYLHAALALSFHYLPMISYVAAKKEHQSLEEVVADLNKLIAIVDTSMGAPFKAVSYHGDVKKRADGMLQWEMIVDV